MTLNTKDIGTKDIDLQVSELIDKYLKYSSFEDYDFTLEPQFFYKLSELLH